MTPKFEHFEQGLAFILELQSQGTPRTHARDGLSRLRAVMPEVRLDLTWDVEAIGGGVNYSLLLSADGWTYSLGAVPQGALPWPLRGATDPGAEVLVTVDGTVVTVSQAIGLLDFVWRHRSIADRLVDIALLEKERDRCEAEPEPHEVDAALGSLRRERGLEDDLTYKSWLTERHITEENLRAWLRGVLVNRALERVIVGARVDAELERPEQYQRARALVLDLRASEHELAVRLASEGRDLIEISDVLGRASGPRTIEVRDVFRYEVPEVFDATDGTTIISGPAESSRLFRVLERELEAAQEAVRNRIVKRLVADHFRDRRSRAEVVWQWGNDALPGTTFARAPA